MGAEMAVVNELRFRLSISADDYLRYYQGSARAVIARSHDGRRVQFPAGSLRRFVTREGVQGEFALRFDGHNKLIELVRTGD